MFIENLHFTDTDCENFLVLTRQFSGLIARPSQVTTRTQYLNLIFSFVAWFLCQVTELGRRLVVKSLTIARKGVPSVCNIRLKKFQKFASEKLALKLVVSTITKSCKVHSILCTLQDFVQRALHFVWFIFFFIYFLLSFSVY